MIGININDKHHPFTELILSGIKTIETRKAPSLHAYVGKRVGVIRTGKGKATLVGFVTIREPVHYRSEEHFRRDETKHCVKSGSHYDIDSAGKWGYPILNPVRVEPQYINSKGIIARQIGGSELYDL
jgi:hypothetical protein